MLTDLAVGLGSVGTAVHVGDAGSLLKEQFRLAFQHRGAEAIAMLDAWLSWARRCRIPTFVKLARRVVKHRASIEATLTHGLSNALVESTNTKLRLLTRLAYGFRSTDDLIALWGLLHVRLTVVVTYHAACSSSARQGGGVKASSNSTGVSRPRTRCRRRRL